MGIKLWGYEFNSELVWIKASTLRVGRVVFSWMMAAGLLICITHTEEEILKTLLFFLGAGGWVKWLEIMLVIGNNVGNRKIWVLFALKTHEKYFHCQFE